MAHSVCFNYPWHEFGTGGREPPPVSRLYEARKTIWSDPWDDSLIQQKQDGNTREAHVLLHACQGEGWRKHKVALTCHCWRASRQLSRGTSNSRCQVFQERRQYFCVLEVEAEPVSFDVMKRANLKRHYSWKHAVKLDELWDKSFWIKLNSCHHEFVGPTSSFHKTAPSYRDSYTRALWLQTSTRILVGASLHCVQNTVHPPKLREEKPVLTDISG